MVAVMQSGATTAETATGDRSYPFDVVLAKGQWAARLTGTDPKYGAAREFLSGRAVKSRGVRVYSASDVGDLPAYVERTTERTCSACGGSWAGTRELLVCSEVGWRVIASGLSRDELEAILEGTAPGDPVGFCEAGHLLLGELDGCGECDEAAERRAAADDGVEVF